MDPLGCLWVKGPDRGGGRAVKEEGGRGGSSVKVASDGSRMDRQAGARVIRWRRARWAKRWVASEALR